jgi:hypothetical protein
MSELIRGTSVADDFNRILSFLITVELTFNNRDSARVEKKVEQIQNKLRQINVRRSIEDKINKNIFASSLHESRIFTYN